MSVAEMPQAELRWARDESSRLAWAFGISLALHLLVFGSWEAGNKLGLWKAWRWPAWMQSAPMLTELLKKKEPKPPDALSSEPPLLFVDVSSAQATAEPPKDAKFYSDKNSQAANKEVTKESDVPNITGQQTEVVKTVTVTPRPEFTPLQPVRPPAEIAREEQPEQKARPAQPPGDLAMGKPDPNPRSKEGKEAQPKPRTIREAMARRQERAIPGEQMKQEGGVRRHLEFASLDAKATPFGSYDAAMVEAISQRWYSLLDQRDYASDSRGKVVLQFILHQDGRITEMNVTQNSVGEVLALICQKAVMDPAPYPVWPADMRRLLGETRNIQFTFYYN